MTKTDSLFITECDCEEWKKWAWLIASRKSVRFCPYCGKQLAPDEEKEKEK